MSEDKTFKHESLQDRTSVLAYLDALRQSFIDGKLVLASKDKELELEPKGLIRFDIEAKRKGDQRKLTLKMSWKEGDDSTDAGDALVFEARPGDAS